MVAQLGLAGSVRPREDPLGAVLRRARPLWSARDLDAAEAKLARLDVTSRDGLARALAGGLLNERLRAAGLRAFGAETLEAFAREVGAAPVATPAPVAAPGPAAAPVAAPSPAVAPAVAEPRALAAATVPTAASGAGVAAGSGPAGHSAPGAQVGSPVVVAEAGAEAEQRGWSALELELWRRTGGLFHPRDARAMHRASPPSHVGRHTAGRPGCVSVVTPTTGSRRDFHRILWTCFTAQSWPEKELIVVETYDDQPSEFLEETAKTDRRLVYVRFQRPPGADWSIGLKRNIGAHLASGEFIAHFDDDDIYAPTYLSTLVPELTGRGAQGVTLSSWYIFDTETGAFGFCDPVRWGGMQGLGLAKAEGERIRRKVDAWAYGYGFSYVYRRRAALECPFGDRNLGEDLEFFEALRGRHGARAVALLEDASGVCLHTQHGRNTSTSVALWEVSREEVADLDVADLVVFDAYLWLFPRSGARSRHVEDWTGRGDGPVSARRRLRDLALRTPYGDVTLRCPRGALLRDVLAEAEGELGALSPHARVLRAPPRGSEAEDEGAAVGARERVGAHCRELWLQPPPAEAPRVRGGPRTEPHVRIFCPASGLGEGSVSRVFHVPLAQEARCADLRRALPGLPPAARVLASLPSGGRAALADGDAVPEEVFLGRFEGTVTLRMVVTREQAKGVQEALKQAMQQPEMQRKLDELQERAAGSDSRYRAGLRHLLNWEVYPPLVRSLGLEEDGLGPYVLWQGIGAHLDGDLELNERWLELELLMRNRAVAQTALEQVNGLRRRFGLPELG